MKILDTNAVNFILKSRVNLADDYCITDDVREEADIAEIVIGRKLSSKVRLSSSSPLFDLALYIAHYKSMLNKHKGRSFYNMTGFGDVSILALLKTIEETAEAQSQGRLFDIDEELEVFTGDQSLIKKIAKESRATKILKNVDIK